MNRAGRGLGGHLVHPHPPCPSRRPYTVPDQRPSRLFSDGGSEQAGVPQVSPPPPRSSRRKETTPVEQPPVLTNRESYGRPRERRGGKALSPFLAEETGPRLAGWGAPRPAPQLPKAAATASAFTCIFSPQRPSGGLKKGRRGERRSACALSSLPSIRVGVTPETAAPRDNKKD